VIPHHFALAACAAGSAALLLTRPHPPVASSVLYVPIHHKAVLVSDEGRGVGVVRGGGGGVCSGLGLCVLVGTAGVQALPAAMC